MGVSTDAVLFYGYCWNEETDLFGDQLNRPAHLADGVVQDVEMDWPEAVLRRRGVHCPWDDCPRPSTPAAVDAWAKANREAMNEWYRAHQSVTDEFGVSLRYHCSHDCPMPYLCPSDPDARVVAWLGYPRDVAAAGVTLAEKPGWRERFNRWLEEFGIAAPAAAPRWWLVSYWG